MKLRVPSSRVRQVLSRVFPGDAVGWICHSTAALVSHTLLVTDYMSTRPPQAAQIKHYLPFKGKRNNTFSLVVTACIESIALAGSHKLGVSAFLKQRNNREVRLESQRSSSHELTRRLIAFPSRRAVTLAAKRKREPGKSSWFQ